MDYGSVASEPAFIIEKFSWYQQVYFGEIKFIPRAYNAYNINFDWKGAIGTKLFIRPVSTNKKFWRRIPDWA